MNIKEVFKAGRQNMSGSYLFIILFSLTLTACGSGSSDDPEPNNNIQNDAATDGDTLGNSDTGTNGQTDMSSGTDGENISDANTDAGTDAGETTSTDDGSTADGGTSEPVTGVTGGNVSLLGSISIEQSGQSAIAVFQSTNQSFTAQQIQSNFLPNADSCQVFESTPTPIVPTEIPGFEFELISAGDVITLTSPAGTFAELVRNDTNGFTIYEIAGGGSLPGAVPPGTVIDIPGDMFPAFSNVAIPNVPALTNVALSTGSTLTANTTVTWDASTGSEAFVFLSASFVSLPDFSDPNFDPADFDPADFDPSAITAISVSCTLLDDGTFSFPADIVSQIGEGFMADNFSFSRSGFSFQQQGNALLTINVSSTN